MPKNTKKQTTHSLRNGDVVVALRPNTNKWQMRVKKPDGVWEYKSSKTSDLDEAKQRAMDRYDELKFRQKNDMPLDDGRKFLEAANAYKRLLQELADVGASKPIHETYLRIVGKWLIPFFGKKDLHDIDEGVMSQYDSYVRNQMGSEPAKSTINSHNVVIRAIFDVAVKKKWLTRSQVPITTVKGKGKKAIRRPHFESAEWNKLTSLMHGKWRTKSKLYLSRYKREVLRIYVLVLGNTGMRPGIESLGLKWKDVSELKLNKQQIQDMQAQQPNTNNEDGSVVDTVLQFRVEGKTSAHQTEGQRMVTARLNVKGWLEELKELTGRTDNDDYLFCMPDGSPMKDFPHMFQLLLEQVDMRYNAAGQPRVLYSLRHMYATMRVRKGLSYHVLADQMGTSVEMIERHYSHVKNEEYAVPLAI
ncbi:MAG: tyrosine-type recombinase/integrase [Rhodospirillaceae bacterium]|nr:tyrosine-type recombinase/integrase [Rhodospirillaceae bacterium]